MLINGNKEERLGKREQKGCLLFSLRWGSTLNPHGFAALPSHILLINCDSKEE